MQPDPSNLAGIHATIISLIIASLFAYSLYIYQIIDSMTEIVLEEARKINNLENRFLSNANGEEWENYKSNPKEKFPELLNELQKMNMALLDEKNRGKNDLNENGERAIKYISWICTNYPFPSSVHSSEKKMRFNNIEDVENWLPDLKQTVSGLLFIVNTSNMFGQENSKIDHLLKAISVHTIESDKPFKKLYNELKIEGMGTFLRNAISQIFENLRRTENLMFSVQNKLDKIEFYKGRIVGKKTITTGFILAGIVFFTSVILPMYISDPHPIFYVWIPSLYYFSVFLYLLIKIEQMY